MAASFKICVRSISCLKTIHFAKTGIGQVALLSRHAGSPTVTRQWTVPCVVGAYTCMVPQREYSFYTRVTAAELWQGVSGVSNAGKKRGRGKRVGRKRKTDLNKGQTIGDGRSNMVWPGLNAPVIKGRERVQMKQLPPNPDFDKNIQKIRDDMNQFRLFKVPPLLRGWSGSRFPGMSMGPPDPVGDYVFEGFDSRVLEFKLVTNMTGNLGRKMRFSAFMVVGNKNGLGGYALAKSPNGKSAIRKAKNMAAQRLAYIERFDNHTVFHNFYTKEKQTAIFVKKKEKGFGLTCHRALKTICETIGIKDMYAKVEGSTSNVQNLTKAFFAGLRKLETHQELADRVKLNVVEFRKERNELPTVMASPKDGDTRKNISTEEDLAFERLYYGGKVPYVKPKRGPPYEKLNSWKRKKQILYKERNQIQCQIERLSIGLEKHPHQISKQIFED